MVIYSCCLVTYLECNCTPPEPFVNEEAISWISPYTSGTYLMENIESNIITQQTLEREYEEGEECIGGDECCSLFTAHIANFRIIDDSTTSQNLIYTKAVQDYVTFSVKVSSSMYPVLLGVYDIRTKTLTSILLGSELQLSDTIIGGNQQPQIKLTQTLTHPDIAFKTMTFVKDLGVTSYVDNASRLWLKK